MNKRIKINNTLLAGGVTKQSHRELPDTLTETLGNTPENTRTSEVILNATATIFPSRTILAS